MQSIHAVEYDSAMKKSKVLTPPAPWMDLEAMTLTREADTRHFVDDPVYDKRPEQANSQTRGVGW